MFARAMPLPPLVWPAFFGAVLAAWVVLMLVVRDAALPSGAPPGLFASLCLPASEAPFAALWAMWALMAAAMMLPTFAPALATYRDLGATGATNSAGAVALVGGYLAVWLAASAAGALAQTALAGKALLGPDGASLSHYLTAALLIGAGVWQFSAVKAACLSKCRHPLTFFLERWRPGTARAARMGAELGAHCLGCCWALMALAFVGGTMNLLWMGAATLFMTLEKLPDIGRWLTRPAGAALIGAGVAALLV